MKKSGFLKEGTESEKTFSSDDEEQEARSKQKCDFYNAEVGDLNETDGYDCPLCKNKGYIAKPRKSNFGYWYEAHCQCKCYETRASIRRMHKSGLKNRIKDCRFDTFETTEKWQSVIKEAAVRFTKDDEHTWFFIGGMTGCGKTHICTAIARHYLLKGKTVQYMLWRDEVVRLKASVTDAKEYGKLIDEWKKVEVLYIDDLFKTGKTSEGELQKPTAADVNIAFEILNYRYNNPELVTIISSESKVTDILDIDEAIAGRIAEKTTPHGYGINIAKDQAKNYRLRGTIDL